MVGAEPRKCEAWHNYRRPIVRGGSQKLGVEPRNCGAWYQNYGGQLSKCGTQPLLGVLMVGAEPRNCEAWHSYRRPIVRGGAQNLGAEPQAAKQPSNQATK